MAAAFRRAVDLAAGFSRRIHEIETDIQEMVVANSDEKLSGRGNARRSQRSQITEKPRNRRQIVVVTVDVTVDSTVSVFVAVDANGKATATTTLPPAPISTTIPSLNLGTSISAAQVAIPSSLAIPSSASVAFIPNTVVNTVVNAVLPAATTIPTYNSDNQPSSIAASPSPAIASIATTQDIVLPAATTTDPFISDRSVNAETATGSDTSTASAAATTELPSSVSITANATIPTSSPSSSTTALSSTLLNAFNVTSNTTTSSATTSFSSLLASNLSTTLLTLTSLSTSSSTLDLSSVDSTSSSSIGPTSGAARATPVAGVVGSGSTSNAGVTGQGTSGNGDSSSNNPPTEPTPPPVIAGAVTGSVGAAAIVIVILWLFLRWYRRRTSRSGGMIGERSFAGLGEPGSKPERSMTERRSFLPPAAVSFISRHRHRASSPTLPTGEQGFQKVLGRKMPSQFGMDTNEAPMVHDFEADRQYRYRSMFTDASALRESQLGLGEGRSAYDPEEPAEWETYMPSPARTPVVLSPDPFLTPHATPITTPIVPEGVTFGRSPFRRSHSAHVSEIPTTVPR